MICILLKGLQVVQKKVWSQLATVNELGITLGQSQEHPRPSKIVLYFSIRRAVYLFNSAKPGIHNLQKPAVPRNFLACFALVGGGV
jgi:hypothetical protein